MLHQFLRANREPLQNAFKFSHPHSSVTLHVHSDGDRILLDVHDQCGGLPPGDPQDLFAPYTQANAQPDVFATFH